MADTDGINCRYFASPVFIFIGAVMSIGSVITNHWTTSWGFDNITYGLWKLCQNTGHCDPIPSQYVTSELLACRGFLVFGLLACVISIIMILVYHCFPRWGDSENKLFPILSAGCGVAAGISSLVGIVLWASVKDFIPNLETTLGFSFFIGAFAAIIILFGSIAGFAIIFHNRFGYRRRYTAIVNE